MSENTKTADRAKFEAAWKYHIDQLQTLSLQAGVQQAEWERVQDKLMSWVGRTKVMGGEGRYRG